MILSDSEDESFALSWYCIDVHCAYRIGLIERGNRRKMSEFQNTYTAARNRFRHLAQTTGGAIGFVAHPDARQEGAGIYGIDTAWFGPRDASNLLVMISGTHGPELLAGSAMQNLWMAEFGQIGRAHV